MWFISIHHLWTSIKVLNVCLIFLQQIWIPTFLVKVEGLSMICSSSTLLLARLRVWFAFCWCAVFSSVFKYIQFWRDETAAVMGLFHYCIIPAALWVFPVVSILECVAYVSLLVLCVPKFSWHWGTGVNYAASDTNLSCCLDVVL